MKCQFLTFTLLIFLVFPSFGFSQELDANTIRLAMVNAPAESGFIQYLTQGFQKETGYKLEVTTTTRPYDLAEEGKADVIISHFGRPELSDFVMSGRGSWPQMVFATQSVLIGPEGDPAQVSSFTSVGAHFHVLLH